MSVIHGSCKSKIKMSIEGSMWLMAERVEAFRLAQFSCCRLAMPVLSMCDI